jgi:hypothetical protein
MGSIPGRLLSLLLASSLVAGPTALLAQPQTTPSPATDPDFATGMAQVREGDFDAALITLDGVVQRLSGQNGREKELARAYTYLAIAYVGLAQRETAKAKFLEAWKADHSLTLSPREFPPSIIDLFEQARKDAEQEARTQPKANAPSPAPTAPPKVAAAPPPAAHAPEAGKKGGSKVPLVVLGVAGAGAAVALAAGGGGGGASSSGPVTSTPPTPTPTTLPSRTTTAINGSIEVPPTNDPNNSQYIHTSDTVRISDGPIDATVEIRGVGAAYTFDFCSSSVPLTGGLGPKRNRFFPNCVFAGNGGTPTITVSGTARGLDGVYFFLAYNEDGPIPSATRVATFSGTCTHP